MSDDIARFTAENIEADLIGHREMIHKKLIEMTHMQYDLCKSYTEYACELAEIGFIKPEMIDQVEKSVAESWNVYHSFVKDWLNMVGLVEGKGAQ